MKALTVSEMQGIFGGKNLVCSYCGKKFKDKTFFGLFTYSYAETQLNQHYSICSAAKKYIYGH